MHRNWFPVSIVACLLALVVAGVGVNVTVPQADLPVPTATSLQLCGHALGRVSVAAAIGRADPERCRKGEIATARRTRRTAQSPVTCIASASGRGPSSAPAHRRTRSRIGTHRRTKTCKKHYESKQSPGRRRESCSP